MLAVTGVAGVTLAGVDKEERKVREKKTSVQCFSQYFFEVVNAFSCATLAEVDEEERKYRERGHCTRSQLMTLPAHMNHVRNSEKLKLRKSNMRKGEKQEEREKAHCIPSQLMTLPFI